MTDPVTDFVLPNLADLTVYPSVSYAASCTDPPPSPAGCFPEVITVVRPFALPTVPLGQLTQPLTRMTTLLPPAPTMNVQCPSIRFDLAAANTPAMTGTTPAVSFLISRPENDACLPVVLPQITFPCTSVTAATPGTVTSVNSPNQAGVSYILTNNDTGSSCSTDLRVNVAVPCVVPTFLPATYSQIQTTASPPGGNTVYLAAQGQYATDSAAYATDDAVYAASVVLFTTEQAAYVTALAAYNAAYPAWQTAMTAYYVALQQQPTPSPLPTAPTEPTLPVPPLAPVGPPAAPAAPAVSEAAITTVPSPSTTLLTSMLGVSYAISCNADQTGFLVGDVIQIGSEQMLVAGLSAMELTVQRGANGTTVTAHTAGEFITVVAPTGGAVSVLVSGPPCNQQIAIGVKVRMPSSAGGSPSSGSTGGGGFVVGTVPMLPALPPPVSPFAGAATIGAGTYVPGAQVPIVDMQGVLGPAGTQVDSSANYILNQTGRVLVSGDVVSAVVVSTSPPSGYTAQLAVTS